MLTNSEAKHVIKAISDVKFEINPPYMELISENQVEAYLYYCYKMGLMEIVSKYQIEKLSPPENTLAAMILWGDRRKEVRKLAEKEESAIDLVAVGHANYVNEVVFSKYEMLSDVDEVELKFDGDLGTITSIYSYHAMEIQLRATFYIKEHKRTLRHISTIGRGKIQSDIKVYDADGRNFTIAENDVLNETALLSALYGEEEWKQTLK